MDDRPRATSLTSKRSTSTSASRTDSPTREVLRVFLICNRAYGRLRRMSLLRRFRARREEREQVRAALAELAAAFGAGRRVLLDGQKAEGLYDVVASENAKATSRLAANGVFICASPPAGFASIHRF